MPEQPENLVRLEFKDWNGFGFIFSALMLYGFGYTVYLFGKLGNIPTVTYEQFEQDYLLPKEVRKVNLVSGILKVVSGISAEVILNEKKGRNYQKVGIITDVKVLSHIKSTESQSKIPSNEAVRFGLYFPEIYFILGCLLLMKKKHPVAIPKHENCSGNNERLPVSFIKVVKTQFESLDLLDPIALLGPELRPTKHNSNITFKDIAGLRSAKIEINEFLDYLNKPKKYIQLGARLPKGALLLGPPGCGKTLLVKALANESKVPFFYTAGPFFVSFIGGAGAKHIRRLFMFAKQIAPAIIFIDEIEAIGKRRSENIVLGSESNQIINQLLVEMDGMNSVNEIIVFAATNKADTLDSALVRPGRFDRHIFIDYPVLEERTAIFQLFLSKYKKLATPIDILKDKLASQTAGMTGADICNFCNEAAIIATKFHYTQITDECFEKALERIISGDAKKNNFLTKEDRNTVAFHEAGHVIVGWFLKYADPIVKVSIVPRTSNALGFAQRTRLERYMITSDYLNDRIATLLGGRAAESISCNQITSGAHDDLKKVKKLAFSMIREWGMSEKVGHLSFKITDEVEAYDVLPYSNGTKALIEAEASNIISCQYKRAEAILLQHVDKLEILTKELLKREVLNNDDIEKLIGPRPHHC